MNDQPSNAGFVSLHSPEGMVIVGISFVVFIAIILVGGLAFRRMQEKDREVRRQLREAQRGK